MTANTDHRQSWFGLIATLICIVIIFALLMPALQDVRTPTRRNECTNRVKNLAVATVNFETTKSDTLLISLSLGSNPALRLRSDLGPHDGKIEYGRAPGPSILDFDTYQVIQETEQLKRDNCGV